MDWEEYEGGGPRNGGLTYKSFFRGQEGSPDNYFWTMVKGDGARYSPRHRHNFDQVRYALKGDVSIGTRKVVKEGEVGYFPEGTHYGPQDDNGNERTTLVLQFGGASGQGYMSRKQAVDAMNELKKVGRIEKGIFYRTSGPGKKNQDAFEAIWEHVHGRKLQYPKRRYQEPVIFDPRSFGWKPTAVQGVSRKLFGVFTERETRIEAYKLEAGATYKSPKENAVNLGFIVEGTGTFGGQIYDTYTATEALPGEQMELTAKEATEFFLIVLPPIPIVGAAAA
jgi:hypothetical protein